MLAPSLPSARAIVALQQPSAVLLTMCRRFQEYGTVTGDARQARLQTTFGVAELEAGESTLTLHAQGHDEITLSYFKWSLAEHLVGLGQDGAAPVIVWSGDQRVGQPLPFFREMRVVSARALTPLMRRVTLAGHNLEPFSSGGMHVRMLLPLPGTVPEWPVTGADGRPQWPAPGRRPVSRIYTIRSVDPSAGTIEIDMVLHQGSAPGSDFARRAQAGDLVGLMTPSGNPLPPADWYLLAGDETALPAIARMLPSLPARATAVVRIEVANRCEEQLLTSPAKLDLCFLHRNGVPAGSSPLLANALNAIDWPQDNRRVYAWSGCEHKSFKSLRHIMREERGLGRDQHLAAAYWRLGACAET